MRSYYIVIYLVCLLSINTFICALIDIMIAKIMGFSVTSFQYLGFEMNTVNKKKEFRFGKFSLICQHSVMKQTDTDKEQHIQMYLSLGILSFIKIIIIILCICNIFQNRTTFFQNEFFLILPVTVLYFLYDVISQLIMKLRFFLNEDKHLVSYIKKILRETDVVPLEKIYIPPYQELGLLAEKPEILMYDWYRFSQKVWMEQWDELDEIVKECVDILNELSTNYINIKQFNNNYYNILFYYSFINKSETIARSYYNYISSDLVNDKDSNGYRVLAYYEYFINHNAEKARLLVEEAKREINNFPGKQFEREYEYKLICMLSYMIEQNIVL